jgi:putative lipoprotein
MTTAARSPILVPKENAGGNAMTISRRSLIALAGAAIVLPAARTNAQTTMLMGTVNYREETALPSSATILVQLVDVSKADAPAQVIAEDRITGAKGSPIPYRLQFDQSRIRLGRSYALQARISDGDKLLFVNTSRHGVFAGGRNNTRILVQRVNHDAR